MILPENLDRCNKITHAGDKFFQKNEAWSHKNPVGERQTPEEILGLLVSARQSSTDKVFHAVGAPRPMIKRRRLSRRYGGHRPMPN
jgi:hypothetical protein